MFGSRYSAATRNTHGITGRSRGKRVFANSMVAHVWAQQSQTEGRSSNGNFYFRGPTIYSYGEHFPIATFTNEYVKGEQVVLFTTRGYSVTTSQHISDVRGALRGLPVHILECYEPRVDTSAQAVNLKSFIDNMKNAGANYAKPRKRLRWQIGEDTEATRITHLESYLEPLETYCRVFGLNVPPTPLTELTQAITAAYAKYNAPERVKARAKSAVQASTRWASTLSRCLAYIEGCGPAVPLSAINRIPREMRIKYSLPGYIARYEIARGQTFDLFRPKRKQEATVTPEQWQDGAGSIGSLDTSTMPYDRLGNAMTLIRRKGTRLETSRAAEVPFAHAVAAYHKAHSCRRTGKSWKRNGEQVRVGHFQLDAIDAQGNITAGCHHIEWGEILRLAVREIPEQVRPIYSLPALILS